MVKDGEDKHGLQTTNLKNLLGQTFSRCASREVFNKLQLTLRGLA